MSTDKPYYAPKEYVYKANLQNAGAYRDNYDRIIKDHWKCPAGVRNGTGDGKCWHCGSPKPKEP